MLITKEIKNPIQVSFFSLLLLFSIGSCNKDNLNVDQTELDIEQVLNKQFADYEIVTLNENEILATHQSRSNFNISLQFENHPKWDFSMNVYSRAADDMEFIEIGENDKLTPVEINSVAYSAASMHGDDHGLFVFDEHMFSANIFESDAEYYIEPLREYIPNADRNQYLVVDVSNIISNENDQCGDESIPDNLSTNKEIELSLKNNFCHKLEITFLGDFQLYRDKFSSNSSNAFSWLNQRIVYASYRFDRYNNFALNLIKKRGYLYTTNVTVASASNNTTFLNEWRDFGKRNSWLVKGDINMLFTGRNKSVAGLAKSDSACYSYAYAFVEKETTNWNINNLVAHESGHTIGARHQSWGIMCRNLGCASSTLHPVTKDQISSFLSNAGRSCISYSSCN